MNPQQLKNSILKRAMEGRLVPQRAEEGTAKELLRKIQAEQAQLLAAKKIRKYVHNCICGPLGQNIINAKAVGARAGFSAQKCKEMLIPLPPLAEQHRIVAKLEELLPLCEQLQK